MDLESNHSVKKSLVDEELEARRKKFKKLIIIFKFFFITLTLIMAAVITYLVQFESSEQSFREDPSSQISILNESEILNLSLQNSAHELDAAVSLLLSNYSGAAFASCGEWLNDGSEQLRIAIRVNPFPTPPGEKQRIEMASRVAAAERDLESCLGDLAAAAESSESAYEVAERVYRAAARLRGRGDLLMSRREKILRRLRETVWDAVLENLIIVCSYGFQMLFIVYLFWKIFNI